MWNELQHMDHEQRQMFWSTGIFGVTFLILCGVGIWRTRRWDPLAVALTILAGTVGLLFTIAALSVPYHSLDVLTPYRVGIRYAGAVINLIVIVALILDGTRE